MTARAPLGKGLHIQLATSSKAQYASGDKVTGHVIWQSPSQQAVQAVHITFKGIVSTRVKTASGQNDTISKGEATLFAFTQALLVGNCTFKGKMYSWPFEFSFPDTALPVKTKSKWPKRAKYPHMPGHSLPPTWTGDCSRMSSGDRENNRVGYYLEAVLVKPSGASFFSSGDIRKRLSISFAPKRVLENPNPALFKIYHTISRATRLMDPISQGRQNSFKGRFSKILSPGSEPTACFTIHAEMPRVAYAGGALPIFLGLELKLDQSTAQVIPIVSIKHIRLWLMAFTDSRAMGPTAFPTANDYEQSWEDKIIILESPSMNLPMRERMDITGICREVKIEALVVPTFKTYNLARRYVLKGTLQVECVQKVFKIELGGRELIILPQICIKTTPGEPSAAADSVPLGELPGLESASEVDSFQNSRRTDRKNSSVSELDVQSVNLRRSDSRARTITSDLGTISGGFGTTNDRVSIFSEVSATSEECRQLHDTVISPLELNSISKTFQSLGYGSISPSELRATSGGFRQPSYGGRGPGELNGTSGSFPQLRGVMGSPSELDGSPSGLRGLDAVTGSRSELSAPLAGRRHDGIFELSS